MASYTTRQRDPLVDSKTQAAIERRSKELLGFALFCAGSLIAAMIWSYSPTDPSWMSATDAPIQNILGRYGAAMAAPLMMIVGKGLWIVPIALCAWGARFMIHWGEDRALGRMIYVPFAMFLAALYAATLTPAAGWPSNFGLGGLFGDTVLGVLLTVLPLGTILSVKVMSLLLGVVMMTAIAFAVGFTRPELKAGARFVFLGTVLLYDGVMRLVGRSASVSGGAARGFGKRFAAHREERRANKAALAETMAMDYTMPGDIQSADAKQRAAAVVRANPIMPTSESNDGRKMPPVLRASRDQTENQQMDVEPTAAAPQPGFLAGLLKRGETPLENELVEPEATADAEAPNPDRISARISDVIRSRAGANVQPSLTGVRIEPKLTVGRGPTPLLLNTNAPVADDTQLFEAEMDVVGDVIDTPQADAPTPVFRRAPETTVQDAASFGGETQQPVTPAPRVFQPAPKKPQPSKRAKAEAQPSLQFEDKYADYEHPPLSLLTSPSEVQRHHLSDEALEENARMLENVLDDYGVKGEIVSVRPGPVVTMYELEPAPGLKASRVIGLSDDIARSMSALSARVSTVPGRTVIGIELPNENREKVVLREILSHRDYGDGNQKLPLALGKDIGGEPIVANLAKMPHLLIAGTTGSGKSVAINTMILSLLYKLSPEECRMIMIDPKMLELSVYDGIPHLLSPVVTDPKKAVVALKWVVGEMEERYRKMSKMGVRNIDGYNGRVKDALGKNEMFSRTVQTGFDDETGDPVFETEEFKPEILPYIVVVVDEMADLMMVAGKEIEACIQRLAQMARASGIHLIMATQRPSVDVITGTIKANFPTRISFQVTSKIDSRTILGEMGAEQLLGMGDMLYMAGGSKITRVHGPFCSDEEVEEIVNHLKSFGPPEYMSGVVEGPEEGQESDIDAVLGLGGNTGGEDALYDQAVAIVIRDRKCSTSYIQRKLAIGYNKAARLVEQMEDSGLVSAANHVGKREILVPEQ